MYFIIGNYQKQNKRRCWKEKIVVNDKRLIDLLTVYLPSLEKSANYKYVWLFFQLKVSDLQPE